MEAARSNIFFGKYSIAKLGVTDEWFGIGWISANVSAAKSATAVIQILR